VLDQTLLPRRIKRVRLRTTADIAEAIASLRVRGAPQLGIVGAMGVAQAALRSASRGSAGLLRDAERAGRGLARTRPTAVNLGWGIERVLARGRAAAASLGPGEVAALMVEEALRIQREDAEACRAMARNASGFLARGATVLTHCNTGSLVTGGWGTALGAIRLAHEEGKGVRVIATETRPLLQGSRLTVWELRRLGIPHALVADGAAAGLIARGEISAVLVGADRIAANGDVANKVGTYPLALAARASRIPFVVVAPVSTFDLSVRDGAAIPVEERSPGEVTGVFGIPVAPRGTAARNPAFDVTPARFVTAIVTERGVARSPYRGALARLVARGASHRAPEAPFGARTPPRRARRAGA
ncbi:MAG: S-methyl-5-thioribose-1-phosphate isomerase, partial [Acidobacteria bacterium]|nr:S-methyl-5-thioribose-1-phosphate isomerase [Acidobacteriota bacterium]